MGIVCAYKIGHMARRWGRPIRRLVWRDRHHTKGNEPFARRYLHFGDPMVMVLTRRWPIEVSLGSNERSDQLVDLRDVKSDDRLDVTRHTGASMPSRFRSVVRAAPEACVVAATMDWRFAQPAHEALGVRSWRTVYCWIVFRQHAGGCNRQRGATGHNST